MVTQRNRIAGEVKVRKPVVRKKKAVLPTGLENLNDKIALKAYQLYQERGCVDGYDQEDWARAKEIVTGELGVSEK